MCAVAAERPLLVARKNRQGNSWEATVKRDVGNSSISVLLSVYVALVCADKVDFGSVA